MAVTAIEDQAGHAEMGGFPKRIEERRLAARTPREQPGVQAPVLESEGGAHPRSAHG